MDRQESEWFDYQLSKKDEGFKSVLDFLLTYGHVDGECRCCDLWREKIKEEIKKWED